ncbi:MAG: 50S ribosomal protein L35 [Rhodospirillaceae bacterium]|jgi:large subunit ribosomal protein L35|nr:50S ribosomal protein L35 [Rhodospirillaceae bacterium]
MPKMKTKSSTKRRFRTTGSGKLKGNFAYKRHCLGSKSQKMKRKARGSFLLADADAKIVKKFLPYGTSS